VEVLYAVWSELNIACENGDCRSEIETLRCRGGLHGNVDELFLTDARSDDEDDDDGNPSVIFVASEGVGKDCDCHSTLG